jgi:GT2 family glycosyltransferase
MRLGSFRTLEMNPTFTIIVPTCRRDEALALCLERLTASVQRRPTDDFEVVVTNDGDMEPTTELIRSRFPWARHTEGPKRGPAANRNHGAAIAKGDWLLFTDDDCIPDPTWIAAYAAAIETRPNCKVFEGRVYADRPRRSLAETAPLNETGGYLWSCNFAIARALFAEIGGFDDRFAYAAMEDVDLAKRLRARGSEITFTPEASVCHPWRYAGGWKKMKEHQESTMLYLAIYPEEAARINGAYYLRFALRSLFRETLPGLFTFRGSGVATALLHHLFNILVAMRLATNKRNEIWREPDTPKIR